MTLSDCSAPPRAALFVLLLLLGLPTAASAADEPRHRIDVSAAPVEEALKRFAQQLGVEVLLPTNVARGVRANAVRGELTVRDALDRMLAGTGLVAVQDPGSRAITVHRPGEADAKKDLARGEPAPAPRASEVMAAAAPADEKIRLSVFEVVSDRDDSYGSSTSTSITGTRKELRRLPVSAEVMNRTLLDDLGAHEVREMILFAAGTGAFMAGSGTTDAVGDQPGDRIGTIVGTLRGLSVGTSRNGFIDNGSSFDGFSKDRIEVIRGPQALLYGATNVSGIIVLNTKRPNLARNSLRGTLRIDSEGSSRGEAEANVSGKIPRTQQQVGLLVSIFSNEDLFWRVNNRIESAGTYVAGTWRLSPRLTLRADYEHATRHSTDPATTRLLAPANNPTYGSRNNEPLRLLLAQGRAADLYGGGLNFANADAFGTGVYGEMRATDIVTAQFDAEIAPWLSWSVQGGFSDANREVHNSAPAPQLTPPGLSGNPTGQWAVNLSPSVNPIRSRDTAWRTIAHLKLPEIRRVRHELAIGGETRSFVSRQLAERWYEINANGEFIRNAAQLNNGNSGRTPLPGVWWAPATQGFGGPGDFRIRPGDTVELNGRRYRRDSVRNQFPQFVAPDNPLGFSNGSSGINYRERNDTAGFATLSGDWFDGRVDTYAGYRYDVLENNLLPNPSENRTFRKGSHMLGVSARVTSYLNAYYGHGTSFLVSNGLSTENRGMPPGSGVGDEVGLKFNLWGDKLSGTISLYESEARNNTANLSAEAKGIVDPASTVNGRANGGSAYAFDRKTRGYELNVIAAPVRGLRIQAGFSHINAREGADAEVAILYNDQFNVNAAGQVTLGNGTPLLVPVNPGVANWNPASPTPGVATQVLTVAMLRNGDAAGNYRAALNPANGAILNATALYLNAPTVGTGVTGLPIARHQLGFQPPTGSTFVVRQGGDRTTDYPVDSVSLTANYRLPEGRLRGLAFGGNFRWSMERLAYYYTDRSNPGAPVRRLHTLPDDVSLMLFAGYDRRIGRRLNFRTQLHVTNALDRVSVLVFPSLADGSPENARLSSPPRVWAWTNTIQF